MKRTFLTIALAVFTANIFAQTPNSEGAAQFAQEFINRSGVFRTQENQPAIRRAATNTGVADTGQTTGDLRTAYQTAAPKQTPLFVFQPADSEGFVMVAQTGDNYAVVGYSDRGGFNAAGIPPQLRAMMDLYEDSLIVTPALSRQSSEMTASDAGIRRNGAGSTPLLDQKGISLNQFYHEEVGGVTGCMATACAQIMAYHQYPNQGVGSRCLSYNSGICADFGNTTYNWNNPTNEDYKKLSLHVGIAMDMRYTSSGSSPSLFDNIYHLRDYFGYTMQTYTPDRKACIDEGYPLFAGIYGRPDNHAIVIDGYDENGLWHFNLGWGGSYNGYYAMMEDPIYFPVPEGMGVLRNIYSTIVMLPTQYIAVAEQDSLALVDLYNSINRDLYDNYSDKITWDLSQRVATWKGVTTWNGRVHLIDIVTTLGVQTGGGEVTAHIPESFGNLTELRELKIRSEGIGNTLILPQSIGQCTNLRSISINGSGKLGQIPASIGQCANLEELWLSSTGLTGNITPEIGNCTNLRSLVLSFNQLTGSIPASFGNLSNLETLSLGNNQLTGTVPDEFVGLTSLKSLGLSNNQLSGNIPTVVTKIIRAVDLSNNLFSGEIPLSFFERGDLGSINLSNNQLSGALPAAIGNLTDLLILNLSGNKFSGAVPAAIGNLANLQTLNLSDNQFSGDMPEETGNLANLQFLDLSENQFTSLPETMSGLNNLHAVSLHHNLFTSLPPIEVHPMFSESRVTFDASYNLIESLPDFYFNAWKSLTAVNLSHNRLTGFPEGLHRVDDIDVINLSNNRIKKLPDDIGEISPNMVGLWLNDNEIQDDIPVSLLRHKTLSMEAGLWLENNFFTFENIPQIDIAYNRVNFQNPIALKKTVYKVQMGDTLRIDVRNIAPLSRPDNIFHWGVWHDMAYSVEYFAKYVSGIGWRPFPEPTDPVFTIVVNEETLQNRYFCYVTNPNLPLREYLETGVTDDGSWLFESGEQNYAYKPFLFTESIEFELASEAEAFADQNPDTHTLLSKNIGSGGMSDHTVTLVTPAGVRGAMQWEASADGQTWMDVSAAMSNAEIKANVQSVTPRELKLFPQTTAFYRCRITDEGCDPIYSDEIKVNAYGKIIFDQTVSVANDTPTTIDAEDVSVTVPAGFHESDFRLTIIKLDNPPLAKEQPAGKIGAVYDISADFGTQFEAPLYIRLKNINTDNFSPEKIDNYRAVYFDDAQGKWMEFDDMRFSLADHSLCFATHHLTKVSWYDVMGIGYDSYYEQDGITVYFNELDFFNSDKPYEQTPQSWHNSIDAPKLVMDAAHYLKEVMNKINAESHIDSRDKFTIYVKPMGEAEGEVSLMGTFGDYMVINSRLKNPEQLCKTIAHEYMHYIQDDFMLYIINDFWMEAHATLADRVVWDDAFIAQAESEQWLQTGLNGQIFDNLALPWDYFDGNKPSDYGGRPSYYLAGCFMSYMQQYRAGTKLEPLKLLSQTFTQWRRHLNDYIVTNLNSTIGDEYENFVKYLLSGENAKFKALTPSNSLQYVMAAKVNSSVKANGEKLGFATVKNYNMTLEDKTVEETVSLSIPYLSSRAVVFNNKSKDALTVVQLERLHEPDPNYKVYFAQFDETSKTFKYTDISDLEKYSFVLDVVKQGEGLKQKYISFLLLINKDADRPIFDFAASYEVTATPIMNANYFATVALSGTTLTWAGGEEFATGSAIDNLSITKQLKDESTLLVNAGYTYVFSAGDIVFNGMVVRRTVEIAQQLEYNYVQSEFKISQTRTDSDIEDYYNLITDDDGHYQPVFSHTVVKSAVTTEGTIHLKGVTEFEPMQSDGFGGINPNYVVYISPSAAVARENIVSATDNGAAVDVSGVTQLVLVLKVKN